MSISYGLSVDAIRRFWALNSAEEAVSTSLGPLIVKTLSVGVGFFAPMTPLEEFCYNWRRSYVAVSLSEANALAGNVESSACGL